jgi:DNA-binding CsgD family transcriptional regulator
MVDPELVSTSTAFPGSSSPSRALIRTGADLVHLTEDLYQRLFRLMCGLLAFGSVVSVWLAHLDHREPSGPLTTGLAAVGLSGALVGLRYPRPTYSWLRYSGLRQQLPGLIAAVLVLVDGPYSPTWWLAFPLLSLMASVASTRATLAWAVIGIGALAGGTLLHGASLAPDGDVRYLTAAAGLPALSLFARGIGEWFARFMLRLHQVERGLNSPTSSVRIWSVQGRSAVATLPAAAQPRYKARRGRPRSRLTARQLEVALLLRDGLHQAEIARCLGISARQVERLVEEGRRRVGASTTAELVATVIAEGLVPVV